MFKQGALFSARHALTESLPEGIQADRNQVSLNCLKRKEALEFKKERAKACNAICGKSWTQEQLSFWPTDAVQIVI